MNPIRSNRLSRRSLGVVVVAVALLSQACGTTGGGAGGKGKSRPQTSQPGASSSAATGGSEADPIAVDDGAESRNKAIEEQAAREKQQADEAQRRLDEEAERKRRAQLDAVDNARRADCAGDAAKAEEAYRDVLESDPANAEALKGITNIYRLQERYADAIKLYASYEKSKGDAPDDVDLLNNLGVLYRLTKQFKEAEAALRRVLSVKPKDLTAYKNLAVLYLDWNKLAMAEKMSLVASDLDKELNGGKATDSGIAVNLGRIRLIQDEDRSPGRAIDSFLRAVEINPNDATARFNIGVIALKYRDFATAEQQLSAAAKSSPNDPEIAIAYAFALEGAKKGSDAIAAYERAARLLPKESCDIVWGMAMVYRADKVWDKTVDRLKHYQDLKCTQVAADKVSAELKKAEYFKNPPKEAPEEATADPAAAPATP